MIKTIPLNKLAPSPRNVRRSSDPKADGELKADLEARGLLQNLVVSSLAKPRGAFAVEAGERRRRALQALADEGKLAKDHPICCLVIDNDDAREASLAENFQRLAMNPADECLAFMALVDQGSDADSIARRFGLTMRFVEGRLRLANLAPVVFEALGAGEIGLDVAKAYASTPDTERQAYVFDQLSQSYSGSHPDSIRRMMTQATVGAGDRRALLVGEEAYLAAGGRVERDLFSEESDARWLDVALVERLAAEKMEELATASAAEHGLAFVRPTLDSWVGYPATDGLRRINLEPPALTDEEAARVEAFEAELGGQVALLEDEESDEREREAAEARIRELDAAIDAIVDKPPVLPDEYAGRVGAFLLIGQNGQPRLDPVYYVETASDEAHDGEGAAEPSSVAPSSAAPRAAGLPRRLVDELAMQRRDILAVHVAADPAFALDLAIFLMVDRDGHHGGTCGSSLSASTPNNPVFDFRTPEAPATIAFEQAAAALDRSWTGHDERSARFDAFRALPEEARSAWLGHAVARTLEASAGGASDRSCAFHDHLGALLGIDVASWWRPTGANYFDRVSKSLALEALREVGGPVLAEPYVKSKKPELAEACERIFAGNFIGDVAVKQAALAWVPDAMRFIQAGTEHPHGDAGEADVSSEPAVNQPIGSDDDPDALEEAA